MPKIPQPGPAAGIVVPTNNLAVPAPWRLVYPFAVLRQPVISIPSRFRQTESMVKSDSPSGFFRSADTQGVLSEQSHLHGRS
jgi:hypothetical protein